MNGDGLGDWRHWAATRLASDLPATVGGAPAHKAGSAVYLSTLTRDNLGRIIGFVMPSPAALALSIAMQAAARADALRSSLAYVNNVSPFGRSKGVSEEQCGSLYEFFEQCMIAVTFSINALEIHCNQVIADTLKDGTYRRRTGRKDVDVDADQLQRLAPIEEKLTVVLPTLLSIESPAKKPTWSHFAALKTARNSTIHMKAKDAYQSVESLDDLEKASLFHQFFNRKTMMAFPLFAIEIIDHIRRPHEPPPRWLSIIKSRSVP